MSIESNPDFPAKRITTEMEWGDLVLNKVVIAQVMEIQAWLEHSSELLKDWNMQKKMKQGFRALFYGPPGTGKTFTASLLGKKTNKQVYKIDLSMVISKNIGETEKNLGILFDIAEHKDWILFFDEADALFGKRTNIRDAHDKYANQEAAYLLQRMEGYPGLVILATNFKENIDKAFTRRIHTIIEFKRLPFIKRKILWLKNYKKNFIISKK